MKTEGQAMEQLKLKRLNEASGWLLRLESPGRTEEDLNEWLRWCDADPHNFAAFESFQRDWRDLDALKVHRRSEQSSDLADDLALTPQQKTVLLEQQTHYFAKGTNSLDRSRGFKSIWAMAAGLVVIAATALVWQRQPPAPDAPAHEVTAAATNRSATLPDGSKVILAVQTRVNVDFSESKRQLDLSSGEAYFKVQHEKARPFVVKAGEVSVTAIGTAFDVRRHGDQVRVMVEEGVVEVASQGSRSNGKPTKWRAEAGYQLTYSSRDRTASIESVNPRTALNWRNGELAYVREPLGSVIEDLNRYSTRKIVVDDPDIADLRFTGTAFASGLDDWLKAIQQAYPVTVRETATGDIVLSERG